MITLIAAVGRDVLADAVTCGHKAEHDQLIVKSQWLYVNDITVIVDMNIAHYVSCPCHDDVYAHGSIIAINTLAEARPACIGKTATVDRKTPRKTKKPLTLLREINGFEFGGGDSYRTVCQSPHGYGVSIMQRCKFALHRDTFKYCVGVLRMPLSWLRLLHVA